MMWLVYAGKEFARKKIVLVAAVLTALYVLLYSFGVYEIARHPESGGNAAITRIVQGYALVLVGMLFAQLIVAFLVFFTTMGAISGESDNGLMLAVLARPIARRKVYLGKYAGYAVWIALYAAILFWAVLLPAHLLLHFPLLPEGIVKAMLLFLFIPLLLLAVSMLGSVYLPMLGNGVACALLYGVSLFCSFAENFSRLGVMPAALGNVSFLSSLLLPVHGLFQRAVYELAGGSAFPLTDDTVSTLGPFAPTNVPSLAFIAYAFVYVALLLYWGCAAFARKDIA